MNAKIILTIIGMVSVGMFALPSTVALFAGQHSFINIDPTGNQIDCIKCHGDVKAEIDSETNLATGTKAPHADMECTFCHRLQIGYSSGDSAYVLGEYTGEATYIANGTPKHMRRWMVMKAADYEARLYPDTVSYSASSEKAWGRTVTGKTGATASMKMTPLYDTATFNYTLTVWGWNFTVGGGGNRARQTDIINMTTGNGTVVYMIRGTYYPTYEDVANVSYKDTIPLTKDEAFDPTKVNFSAQQAINTTPVVYLDYAGSRTVNAGSRYHAASVVACMDCHAGASPQPGHETSRLGQTNATDEVYCYRCHYGTEEPDTLYNGNLTKHLRTYQLAAGGFGSGLTDNTFDTGEAEVHTKFVLQNPDNIAVGSFGGRYTPASNAACIACHTHVAVDITYNRPDTLVFTANEFTDGNWAVGGYNAAGSVTTCSNGAAPPC